MGFFDCLCEYGFALVIKFGAVGLEHIGQTKAELQLGTELEKRKIIVTAQSYLEVQAKRLSCYIGLVFGGEVIHSIDTSNYIGPIVIMTRSSYLKIERDSNVCGLHILIVLLACGLLTEGDMLGGEVQGWQHARAQMLVQSPLANESYGETRTIVIVAHPPLLACLGVYIAGIRHYDALLVQTDRETIVERAQVDIGSVLHLLILLCHYYNGACQEKEYGIYFSEHIILTEK